MSDKKFTVTLLCYGNFPQYSLRAVDTIINNCSNKENRIFDFHVGANMCSPEIIRKLRHLSDEGLIDTLFESKENINKSPMKRMLFDRTTTQYALWMDDDSHVKPDWDIEIAQFIESNKPFTCAGFVATWQRSDQYKEFMRKRPWYISDKKLKYQDKALFALGGGYLVDVTYARQHNYPDKGMIKKHDDCLLGDLICQQGGKLVSFTERLKSFITIDDGDRRGTGEDVKDFTSKDPITGKPQDQGSVDEKLPTTTPSNAEFKVEKTINQEAAAPTEEKVIKGELQHAVTFESMSDIAELNNVGNDCKNKGQYEKALAAYFRGLEIAPDLPELLFNAANTLKALGRFEEAADYYQKAVDVKHDYSDAHNNYAILLCDLKRYDDAIDSYLKAIEANPDNSAALCNLGNTYLNLYDTKSALNAYERAAKANPRMTGAHLNIAKILVQLNRYAEALTRFQIVMNLDPNCVEARMERAKLWLLLGEYDIGFDEYENRTKIAKHAPPIKAPTPRSLDALSGKSILVYNEHGFAETIQFLRYIPLLEAQGARVIVQSPPQFLRIFHGQGVKVIETGAPLPDVDYCIGIQSLAKLFETTIETIPTYMPYLPTLPEPSVKVADRPDLKVGILWQGNKNSLRADVVGCTIDEFLNLYGIAGVRFYSLQTTLSESDSDKIRERQHIEHLGHYFNDFSDAAAAISQLDVVITTDCPIAHIAGALNVPTWLALPTCPSWQWMSEGDYSLWYPSMKLFRQEKEGDWEPVFRKIKEELVKLCDKRFLCAPSWDKKQSAT